MKKDIYFIYVSQEGERNVIAYQTETDLKQSQGDPTKPAPFHTREVITPPGQRVIFYKEKHALIYGKSMKEYLGMIEVDPGNSEDRKVFEMSVDEIRAMNLPKINPDPRIIKNIFRRGQSIPWHEFFGR